MAQVTLRGTTPNELDRLLGDVAVLMRNKALKAAIGKDAVILISELKRRIRRSTTRKKGKHLQAAIGKKNVIYQGGRIQGVIVGARTSDPWAGFHFHLYDAGHKMVVSRGPRKGVSARTTPFVAGKRVIAPSVDTTASARHRAVVNTIEAFAEMRP